MAKIVVELPPELDDLQVDLTVFIYYMVQKLMVHKDKGQGWRDKYVHELFEDLKGENRELLDAISWAYYSKDHELKTDKPSLNVCLEAADVANFAMFISSQARKELL